MRYRVVRYAIRSVVPSEMVLKLNSVLVPILQGHFTERSTLWNTAQLFSGSDIDLQPMIWGSVYWDVGISTLTSASCSANQCS
jgi:hypothetical protein